MSVWGSLWGTVLGPAPTNPVKEKLGALYVDELEYDNTTDNAVLINTVPEADETDVARGIAVQLTVASLLNAPLLAVTKVWLTRTSTGLRSLAYDQAGGGFQAGFSGTATVRQSPGAAVDDELVLSIQPATAFSHLERVIVAVETEVFGVVTPFETAYTFTIEDVEGPQLEEVFWITPRKCRVKFDEAVSQSEDPGGARFVFNISGDLEILSANTVRIPGSDLESEFVGYYLGIAGSAHPVNNQWRTVLAINTTTGIATLDTASTGDMIPDTGIDKDSQEIVVRRRRISGSISPYVFSFRSWDEGLSSNDPAETTQAAYLPFPVSILSVESYELAAGEDPDAYVYLVLNDDISLSRQYTLIASGIEDSNGNTVVTPDQLDFTSPGFNVPDTLLKLWDNGILSQNDKTRDTDTDGYLRKLIVAMQDIINMFHYRRQQLQYLHCADKSQDEWLEHLLYNLGNPFRFPAEAKYDKRKLAEALVDIYQHVGTKTGIRDALKVILGYDFEINAYYNAEGWILGDSTWGKLGFTTILHPDITWQRNSYEIVSPVVLTAVERRVVRDVAEWIDPVFMHLARIIEPGSGSTPIVTYYWILGSSSLGVSTTLSS